MKIVHICLNGYVDGWGYQENLLPEYQVKGGDDVTIISSFNHFPSYIKQNEKEKIQRRGRSYEINGVRIERLRTAGHTSSVSFLVFGLHEKLESLQPDLIFHHDVSPTTLPIISRYKRNHKQCIVMVDNHADSINCSKNNLWFNFYYNTLSRFACRYASNIDYYWGVSQLRCNFLKDVYSIPETRIGLLPLGFDSKKISEIQGDKHVLRQKYNIPKKATVIISGGKMGVDKGTCSLIDAVNSQTLKNQNLHLVLFGKFLDEETKKKAHGENVTVLGWCDRISMLELLKLSDIAVWPLLHTSLIEDAAACALPIAVKISGNTSHLLGNNAVGLSIGDENELVEAISTIVSKIELYKEQAILMSKQYDYSRIAEIIKEKYKELSHE